MSQQEFEDVVGDALDRIPEDLAEVMDNVVVLVQDEPDPEMLTEEDYDDSGMPTLLGLYDGVPLTERDEGWSMVLPDRILIFRGPLERWCASREEYWPSAHVVLRGLTGGVGGGRLPGVRSLRPMTVVHVGHTKTGPWVLARS